MFISKTPWRSLRQLDETLRKVLLAGFFEKYHARPSNEIVK